MGCCGSGQRTPNNKTQKKVAASQPLPQQQKGIALKISTQATAQIAAQIAKKNPYFLQNRMM